MSLQSIRFRSSFPLLGCAMLFASVGFATTINYSFENLPVGGLPEDCGGGCVSGVGDIPGWTFSEPNTSGQAQPGAQLGNFTYVNSIPDGITVAFSNLATISQTVGVVQLGVFYSLSVDVGLIKTFGALGSVELLIGNNAPIIATGLIPPEGDWSTYMATYVGLVGDVGQPITISLIPGDSTSIWDNVRLSDSLASPVPEPSTLSIIGLGLMGLVGIAHRRRRLTK